LNPKKIVVTGGPATGKTSLVQGLENAGYKCFHEIIRDLTVIAKETGKLKSLKTNPINSVSDPLEFNRKLLEDRTVQYLQSENIEEDFVFFDRGIPDVLAYMDYYDQSLKTEFIEGAENHRYDIVFLLPMWKDIFVTDEERFESYEEALKIQDCLRKTYIEFGYSVMEVPHDSIENRIAFILDEINS